MYSSLYNNNNNNTKQAFTLSSPNTTTNPLPLPAVVFTDPLAIFREQTQIIATQTARTTLCLPTLPPIWDWDFLSFCVQLESREAFEGRGRQPCLVCLWQRVLGLWAVRASIFGCRIVWAYYCDDVVLVSPACVFNTCFLQLNTGNYIFKDPLREYWEEKQNAERSLQDGRDTPPSTNNNGPATNQA